MLISASTVTIALTFLIPSTFNKNCSILVSSSKIELLKLFSELESSEFVLEFHIKNIPKVAKIQTIIILRYFFICLPPFTFF